MNQPGRYTKRPVTIEAIQWHGGANTEAIKAFVGDRQRHGLDIFEPDDTGDCGFLVRTETTGPIVAEIEDAGDAVVYDRFHGWVPLFVGDWIIRGLKGEFYPCQPEVFAASYEAAEDGADA